MDYEVFRQQDGYFYVIYKIVNKLDNKFYIGYHKSKDLNDGYMGSGLRIKYAIKKYGIENFEKQYLHFVTSYEELFKKEKELVTEDLISRDDCYNIALGGQATQWKKARDHFDYLRLNDKEWNEKRLKAFSETNKKKWQNIEYRENIIKNIKKRIKENGHSWEGKKHSEETKDKMRKPKNQGESNSQFGTCWIHNDTQSVRIKKEDLDTFISIGWLKGRKIKF